jgi:hypothetical protein
VVAYAETAAEADSFWAVPAQLAPFVVQQHVVVEGEPQLRGTVVLVLPGSSLWYAYGQGNLLPLPASETGDDADHVELGN